MLLPPGALEKELNEKALLNSRLREGARQRKEEKLKKEQELLDQQAIVFIYFALYINYNNFTYFILFYFIQTGGRGSGKSRANPQR